MFRPKRSFIQSTPGHGAELSVQDAGRHHHEDREEDVVDGAHLVCVCVCQCYDHCVDDFRQLLDDFRRNVKDVKYLKINKT
jgi:hypothetical protein